MLARNQDTLPAIDDRGSQLRDIDPNVDVPSRLQVMSRANPKKAHLKSGEIGLGRNLFIMERMPDHANPLVCWVSIPLPAKLVGSNEWHRR